MRGKLLFTVLKHLLLCRFVAIYIEGTPVGRIELRWTVANTWKETSPKMFIYTILNRI